MLRVRLFEIGLAAGVFIAPALAKADTFGSFPQNQVSRAWNGFYAGVHLGYTDASYDAILNPGAAAYSDSSGGTTFGLYGGYNIPWNSMLIAGIEGDITGSLPDGAGLAGGTLVMSGSDLSASLRGRLGFTVDQFLIYGTAGFALADIDYATAAGLDDSTELGGVVGIGAEAQISHGLVARAEYLYTNYGSGTYALGPLTAGSSELSTHTLRLGVGYAF
ncbi:MAG: outer membrane beta-barrel protein [Pseudomonadota bacterium]